MSRIQIEKNNARRAKEGKRVEKTRNNMMKARMRLFEHGV